MEAPDEPSIGPKLWVMEASALLLLVWPPSEAQFGLSRR